MTTTLSLAATLLSTALSLLSFIQQHPELPPSSRESAQQAAEVALERAKQLLADTSSDTHSSISKTSSPSKFSVRLGEISTKSTSVKITWSTTVPASAKVIVKEAYAEDDTLAKRLVFSKLSAKGVAGVTGLKPNTKYQYVIEVNSSDETKKVSGTFTTKTESGLDKSARLEEIRKELERIDCGMHCSISLIEFEKFNALSKEYRELGGSYFGCGYEKIGAQGVCTGYGG